MSFIDRLLIGQVVKDFGAVHETRWLLGKMTHSVLLARKRDRLRFVLKSSFVSWVGFSVTYVKLELDEAYQLRDRINQMEDIVKRQAAERNAVAQ